MPTTTRHLRAILLDIDGTLIDSNDAHAHSWLEALHEQGYDAPYERIRGLIGMGGDHVLPTLLQIEQDSPEGKRLSESRGEIFKARYLPKLKAFPQARELLKKLRDQGLKLAVATSAQPDELRTLLQLIDGTDLIEEEASSKDAKRSKPDPDILQAALQRLGYPPTEVLMLGDTAYDIESARKAGIDTIAFRCGGWHDEELKGALAIYDGPADLLTHFDSSPLHPNPLV